MTDLEKQVWESRRAHDATASLIGSISELRAREVKTTQGALFDLAAEINASQTVTCKCRHCEQARKWVQKIVKIINA